jgi:hypothetical protein
MILLRFVLMAMNAAAVGFLIYWLLKVNDYPLSVARKRVILAGGIVLLLLPSTMIMGFLQPTPVYLLMYPIGIALFIYLFRLPE